MCVTSSRPVSAPPRRAAPEAERRGPPMGASAVPKHQRFQNIYIYIYIHAYYDMI